MTLHRTCAILLSLLWVAFPAFAQDAQLPPRRPASDADAGPSKPRENAPILFTGKAAMRSAGILTINFGAPDPDRKLKHLKHKCYDYGVGSGAYDFSVSDGFLARYDGFSLQSLCLGLVSGVRFDPESGERLPTFIVADPDRVSKYKLGADLSGFRQAVTPELPLKLPGCFRGGTPYFDCRMSFDPISGKKLSDKQTKAYRELGKKIDAEFQKRFKAGMWKSVCEDKDNASYDCFLETGYGGWLAVESWPFEPFKDGENSRRLPHFMTKFDDASFEHQTFFDVSKKLQRGYGYALYADNKVIPGPEPSSETLETTQSGSSYITGQSLDQP